jgi:hypothetical protein
VKTLSIALVIVAISVAGLVFSHPEIAYAHSHLGISDFDPSGLHVHHGKIYGVAGMIGGALGGAALSGAGPLGSWAGSEGGKDLFINNFL